MSEASSVVKARQSQLIEDFSNIKSWEDRYKKVIDLGKQIPELSKEFYDDKFLVKGCQSRVWLHAQKKPNGNLEFIADSDAMIVKGLVAILLKVYSDATAADILANPPTFISELGFQSHLSPSRANGLMAMVKQIMLYATAFKALS
jgi:cysteine desulfuration protein SufE